MGWLNNIFEALKTYPEITIPTTAGAVLFFIGLSLLKTRRAIKVAKIGASKMKETADEMKEELNKRIGDVSNLIEHEKQYIQGIDIKLQAFIESILGGEYNAEAKKYFEQRIDELRGRLTSAKIPLENAKEQNASIVTHTKKKLKRKIKESTMAVQNETKILE